MRDESFFGDKGETRQDGGLEPHLYLTDEDKCFAEAYDRSKSQWYQVEDSKNPVIEEMKRKALQKKEEQNKRQMNKLDREFGQLSERCKLQFMQEQFGKLSEGCKLQLMQGMDKSIATPSSKPIS